MKRKLWISPDTNMNFKNMSNLIKYLESLPIRKYTLKKNMDMDMNMDIDLKMKTIKYYNKTKKII
uniref:Uncharacterized protein n=1 Tax=viral metagenome TaxID=1070528 RepID=A0A6C0EXK9_9ZZZZ